jgi:hypothetical protein
MKKQKAKTIKQHVMEFVESKGSARYMEIIEFIVDHNHGEGTYQASYVDDSIYEFQPETRKVVKLEKTIRRNSQRGYYSGAFRKPYTTRDGKTYYPGHFYNDTGYGKLEKHPDGSYIVVHDTAERLSKMTFEDLATIELILAEANAYSLRQEVATTAGKYMKEDASCDPVTAYLHALHDWDI